MVVIAKFQSYPVPKTILSTKHLFDAQRNGGGKSFGLGVSMGWLDGGVLAQMSSLPAGGRFINSC